MRGVDLSYVPEAEQRGWPMVTRWKVQLVRERVRLHNQIEALLEDAQIKLSGVLSELLGQSGRRILQAIAGGGTDAAQLAELCDPRLQCGREELIDALTGRVQPLHRTLLGLYLKRLSLLDEQIAELEQVTATALRQHENAVIRLAAVPGFGAASAQQIIAEVGPEAAAFAAAGQFSFWAGCVPDGKRAPKPTTTRAVPKATRSCAGS